MYLVVEASIADTGRLFRFNEAGGFGADFNSKGFEYPYIVEAREWRRGDRVLDVGAGYSPRPMHLAERCSCEVWAEDDFGLAWQQASWTRSEDPLCRVRANPNFTHVLERLGKPASSSLMPDSFDVIVSASTLEQPPNEQTSDVWRHMDLLLKQAGK